MQDPDTNITFLSAGASGPAGGGTPYSALYPVVLVLMALLGTAFALLILLAYGSAISRSVRRGDPVLFVGLPLLFAAWCLFLRHLWRSYRTWRVVRTKWLHEMNRPQPQPEIADAFD